MCQFLPIGTFIMWRVIVFMCISAYWKFEALLTSTLGLSAKKTASKTCQLIPIAMFNMRRYVKYTWHSARWMCLLVEISVFRKEIYGRELKCTPNNLIEKHWLALFGHGLNMLIATNLYVLKGPLWQWANMYLWGIIRFRFYLNMMRFIHTKPFCFQWTPHEYTLNLCHYTPF